MEFRGQNSFKGTTSLFSGFENKGVGLEKNLGLKAYVFKPRFKDFGKEKSSFEENTSRVRSSSSFGRLSAGRSRVTAVGSPAR
ncbi:hypothetical protein OSB04_006900, partial [Centaurea solstitialis]